MHDKMKEVTGITDASCQTCPYIDDVSDGWEYGQEPYYVCSHPKHKHKSNLKGFPFKTDQICWVPQFWASKFSGMIRTGEDEEINDLYRQFNEAVKSVEEE